MTFWAHGALSGQLWESDSKACPMRGASVPVDIQSGGVMPPLETGVGVPMLGGPCYGGQIDLCGDRGWKEKEWSCSMDVMGFTAAEKRNTGTGGGRYQLGRTGPCKRMQQR